MSNSPKPANRKLHFTLIAQSSLGTFILIATIAYLSLASDRMLLIPPLGATCFILFVLPDSEFAQPRNVLGGHLLSGLTGLLCVQFLGDPWWVVAVSAGLSIAAMQLTHTNHPPAAATNVLVALQHQADWSLLFGPILIGSITAIIVAIIYNRFILKRHYPHYWW